MKTIIFSAVSLLLVAVLTVWAGDSDHHHETADSACADLQLVWEGKTLRLVDKRSGFVVDRFDNVKTTVELSDAGHGPWQGRDDNGEPKTVERVDCAVIVTFAEESTLLIWHDTKGRWHRLWLAD